MRTTVERPPGLDAKVDNVTVNAYSIPTDAPEADGTFEWRQTTIVVVEIEGGGTRGLGYTYTDAAAATLIRRTLSGVIRERSVMDVPAVWIAMARAVRNMGRPGIAATAIAARPEIAAASRPTRLARCRIS